MYPHYLAIVLSFTSAAAHSPRNVSILFQNSDTHISRIPTIYESTLQARRILHLSKIATVSTVFPLPRTAENRPADVAGAPIGQMEYYANCGPDTFNPTVLGVTITTTMKNAAAGSNVTLSLRYHLPADAPPSDDPWAYLPANLPRFALVGYVEPLDAETVEKNDVRNCFIRTHPEASIWEPGRDIHESWWGRLVVREVYFFGGFGDRARIGWLPIEMWRNISQKEVEEYRMIGEREDKSGQSIGNMEREEQQIEIDL